MNEWNSDTIIKGFAMAGIKDVLVLELPSEDPFTDLDIYKRQKK